MKNIFATLLLMVLSQAAIAQQQFIESGMIEFEKRTNVHKLMETYLSENDETFLSMMKKSTPATKVSYFNLYFDNNKTLYKPGKEDASLQKVPEWMEGPGNSNIVFTDLSSGTYNSQKNVFETVFNIQDTLGKIEWKITSDTRTIANMECRKASAIIMDSVFVVAFFTDQVVPSGGPESFTGLPGMILGLAIPRLYTTWFATKLELVTVQPSDLLPPKKGKKTNMADLKNQLQNSLKDWGKFKDKNMWQVII